MKIVWGFFVAAVFDCLLKLRKLEINPRSYPQNFQCVVFHVEQEIMYVLDDLFLNLRHC
tara:strand:+ start:2867 stop:3043 length:177 start_codon:yes stop_codon:yes gene_type:complete